MRYVLAATVAACLSASSLAVAQAPPSPAGWRAERLEAVVHEASLANASGFLRFRCTIIAGSGGMGPRTDLSLLVTFRAGPLRGGFDRVVVTAEDQSLTFRALTEGGQADIVRYQWTTSDLEQINGPGLQLVNGAMFGITVKAPDGSQEVFTTADAAALGDIRRCGTASILATQRAAGSNVDQLLALWGMAEDGCRGGHPPENAEACDHRAAFDERLQQLGWCYGRPGDLGYQMAWRRCRGVMYQKLTRQTGAMLF